MDKIHKPLHNVPEFYIPYMQCVPDDGNLLQHLNDIQLETERLTSPLSEEQLNFRYREGKWTIKDIILHLADCERIIIYRALRFARADETDLPGFDEDLFVSNAGANNRSIASIIRELSILRPASIFFIDSLDSESLDRTGTANNYPLSARLLVNHLYGHHRHHLNIINERYLKAIPGC